MVSDEAPRSPTNFGRTATRSLTKPLSERESSTSATRMLYAVFAPDGRRLHGSFQATRPAALGVHDIMFSDPQEGSDEARGIAVDLSPDERLVVAVDSDWAERDRTDRHHGVRRGVPRRLPARLRRRAHPRMLSSQRRLQLDQRDGRSDHRRRHSAAHAGQRPRRRIRPARRDAQPDARPDRGPARESAAGVERHRP